MERISVVTVSRVVLYIEFMWRCVRMGVAEYSTGDFKCVVRK